MPALFSEGGKMQKLNRLLFVLMVSVLLVAPVQPLHAGDGTYTQGTPDEILLHVAFMYDETCFDNSPISCPNWETLFKESSKLLYDATEKQIRIGKVKFYNNCPEVNAKADVHIYNDTAGAKAHRDGLGRSGYRIRLSQTHKTVTTGTGAGDRGQFGVVHELGHFLFNLGDEYEDKSSNNTADAYCVDQSGTTASIMDGGTTVNPTNRRTEFCWSGNHRAGHTEQDKKRTIAGVDYEDKDSWTFLQAHIKDRWGATLTLPTSNPTSDTAGHTDPTFEYYDCGVRTVTCIDSSGSMDGEPITLARSGASSFVNLTKEADELAVTSYSSSASTNYALATMTAANKTAAKTAIGAITSGGQTNIGSGLQQSLNEITGAGDPVSNEVIVLLSDGQHNTGTDPASVIPALKARGVTVYTIGLGGVDASLMRSIATQTGGNYIYATSNAQLKGHFQQILADLRNNGLIERMDGKTGGAAGGAGIQATHQVYVDSFTTAANEVTFLLTWDIPSEEMSLVVRRPDGTTVSESDPGVEYLYDAANGDKFYRITSPPTGNWSVDVDYAGSAELNYSLQVHAGASDVVVRASANKDTYVYPDPILVKTMVLAGDQVAGAGVTAQVVRPNGSSTQFTLYDDGIESHGDQLANDGVYSNYFSDFAGDGSYIFNVTVNNESGYTTAEEEDEPEPFDSQPVDKFVRKAQVTVVVSGAPAAGYEYIYLPIVIRGFTGAAPAIGFDSQFNGSAAGWEPHSGTWNVDSNYYSTPGMVGSSSSASYAADFANFDYQARLWRSGCDTCANRLIVRGTPNPLASNNWWYQSYVFQYTREGSYSVYGKVADSITAIQDWTSSPAINTGDAWNTVRVVAVGANLGFFINGTLVWSGSDASLASGRVGVGMYQSDTSSGDLLQVDWATLSTLSSLNLSHLMVTDAVSDEQQSLNDAANRPGSGSKDMAP
jgi:hypothetical protein